jgi:hypothetical protein
MQVASFPKSHSIRRAGKIDADDYDDTISYQRGEIQRPKSAYDDILEQNHSQDRRSNRSKRIMNELNFEAAENNNRVDDSDDNRRISNDQKENNRSKNGGRQRDTYENNEMIDYNHQIAPSNGRPTTAAKLRATKSFMHPQEMQQSTNGQMVVSDRAAVPVESEMPTATVARTSGKKKATLADLKKTSFKNDDNGFRMKSVNLNAQHGGINGRVTSGGGGGGAGETTEASGFFDESVIIGRLPKQAENDAEFVDRAETGGRATKENNHEYRDRLPIFVQKSKRQNEEIEDQSQRIRRTVNERADPRAEQRREMSAKATEKNERVERAEREEREREERALKAQIAEQKEKLEKKERQERENEEKRERDREEKREREREERREMEERQERKERRVRLERQERQEQKEKEDRAEKKAAKKAHRKREKAEKEADLEKIESVRTKSRWPESQNQSEAYVFLISLLTNKSLLFTSIL